MDMNKSFVLRKEDAAPKWRVIDATDRVLGRLSTEVADALRGKDKPEFTPHIDCGDYVVIVNCEKVKLTGNKWKDKLYARYSGWRSGLKLTPAKDMLVKHPTDIIRLAVKRMLPKNRLNREVIKKLKIYVGPEHPHQAQVEKQA